MFRWVFRPCFVLAGFALCLFVPGAVASAPSVTCTGVAPSSVPHDLVVPAGGSCTIMFGSTVGHDVIVKPGASLDDRGASIGHDILANRPLGVHVNGGGKLGPGSVGHDVVINGVTGVPNGFQFNSVCNNHVGHNVVVEASASSAGPWSIGDRNGVCGGGAVTVGNSMKIRHNANPIQVEDNSAAFGGGIGQDLRIVGNTGGVVAEANHAGHDCVQSGNSPYTNRDGDNNGPNTAGHSIDSCNTPHP